MAEAKEALNASLKPRGRPGRLMNWLKGATKREWEAVLRYPMQSKATPRPRQTPSSRSMNARQSALISKRPWEVFKNEHCRQENFKKT